MGIARRESLSSGCSTFSLGFLCATGNSCNSGKAFRPLFWILRAPHTDCPHSTISSRRPVASGSAASSKPGGGAGRNRTAAGPAPEPPRERGNGNRTRPNPVRATYGLPARPITLQSRPVHLSSDSRDFFRLVFDTRGSRTATLSCSYYVVLCLGVRIRYHGDRRRAGRPPRRPPAAPARPRPRSSLVPPVGRRRVGDGVGTAPAAGRVDRRGGGRRGCPRTQRGVGGGRVTRLAGARDGGASAEDAPLAVSCHFPHLSRTRRPRPLSTADLVPAAGAPDRAGVFSDSLHARD